MSTPGNVTKQLEQREYSQFVKIFLNVAYGVISSGITFVNKYIFLILGFQSPIVLLMIQCVCNIIFSLPMMLYKEQNKKSFKLLEDYGMRVSTVSESLTKSKMGLRVGLLNLVTVVFGLYSIKYISIPIFLTFRRCSLITTFIVSFMINNVPITQWNLTKMSIVALGSVVSGLDTFNKDWFGFLMVWMNNITQSYYNVYVNKINKTDSLTAFEINAYYAIIGFPIFLAISIANGEIYDLVDAFSTNEGGMQLYLISALLLSGIMGIAITISTLLVSTVCSPFQLNVSGTIKNTASAFISFFVFDDLQLTPLVLAGISIGFFGSCLQMRDELSKFKVKSN